MSSDTVVLSRDCEATQVPFGGVQVLPAGTWVRITQSLGGSYTVATEQGYMLRIEAKDADALGIVPQAQPAEAAPGQFSEKLVWDQLKTVYDPEIPVNIVDLGLIYSCQITPVEGGHKIEIEMSVTAPGCGMGDVLKADIERKLSQLPSVKEVQAKIVFDPPWEPGRMSEAAKLQLGIDLDDSPAQSQFPMIR
ncbi:MAG TPA: putative Fe-S cluster assembly protein SufT [Terriglobales bacterium]|jgi:probable FeS assembly SUF system protein SufT|nr:putative Fe-S cluster assembly protein SufT [Terriglobales bacterium]